MSNIATVITTTDVLAFLGIDYADDMVNANITRAINTADGELRESVGENYPIHHPLTKELALLYAGNAYNNRELSGNEGKRAEQIALKLRLYMLRNSSDEDENEPIDDFSVNHDGKGNVTINLRGDGSL